MDLVERYVVAPHNHRGYLLVVVSIVFVAIAVSLVALRLTIRLRAHSSAGADDWAILVSVVSSHDKSTS
jgi:uncharacterized membrane protein SirB2